MATADQRLPSTLVVNMVTPKGPVVNQAETDAVTAPGELGEFEVLPGHVPLLTALHPGVLVLGERQKQVFAVTRGFLRVDRSGSVEILVEQAVPGAKVDVDAAKSLLKETEEALAQRKLKPLDGDWRTLKDKHDWARAQLDAHARA